MKRAASVLLIFLSLLIGFQRIIIVLHYQLNWERIELQYCENKSSLIMTCKGLCYVQKAFQHSEDKAPKTSKVFYQVSDVIFESLISFFSSDSGILLTYQEPPYLDIRYCDPLLEVLVPPPLKQNIFKII